MSDVTVLLILVMLCLAGIYGKVSKLLSKTEDLVDRLSETNMALESIVDTMTSEDDDEDY